ncbi:MAG: DUF4260 domain-containing protein [Sphingobacteriales bacterium]|nr:DUF4260 domain-containing protein [Sphingobacteriales bacterium]
MKNILKLEEAGMLALSIFMLTRLEAAWWWYLLLLIGPDISMAGYLAGNKTGAACYNLFHHKGVAVACLLAGWLIPSVTLVLVGIVLFGHSSMDRALGYGLKTTEGFKYTHLGIIGKN